jgi:RNA polymerase sigma-70 factor, ECF subfamily
MGLVTVPAPFAMTLEAAQTGSEPALSSLYLALQPEVLAFMRARAPRDADDLSSEVWVDVTRGIARFAGDEAGFRAWVFTIARRRLIDARRQSERRPTTPLGELERAGSEHDPETALLAATGARELLAGLPKDQADVVRFRVVDGLSVDEAAARLGKRPGTVRVLQHRGLRRLAVLLAAGVAALALTFALALGGALSKPAQALAREIVDRVGLGGLVDVAPEEEDPASNEPVPSASADDRATPAARAGTAGGPEPETAGPAAAPVGDVPAATTRAAVDGEAPVTPSGPEAPAEPPPGGGDGPSGPPPDTVPESPPGLDGVIPPGQGGTPPGHGGVPPGQAKKT